MVNLSFCRRLKYDIISLKYSSIDIPVTGGHVGQFEELGECVGIDGKVGIVGNVESTIKCFACFQLDCVLFTFIIPASKG